MAAGATPYHTPDSVLIAVEFPGLRPRLPHLLEVLMLLAAPLPLDALANRAILSFTVMGFSSVMLTVYAFSSPNSKASLKLDLPLDLPR